MLVLSRTPLALPRSFDGALQGIIPNFASSRLRVRSYCGSALRNNWSSEIPSWCSRLHAIRGTAFPGTSIPNSRHAQRRRVSIFFRTLRGFASWYPPFLPPSWGGGLEEERTGSRLAGRELQAYGKSPGIESWRLEDARQRPGRGASPPTRQPHPHGDSHHGPQHEDMLARKGRTQGQAGSDTNLVQG